MTLYTVLGIRAPLEMGDECRPPTPRTALFEVLTWQKEMRNFSFTPVIHLSATGLY
jgi:hypothetical protein